MSVSDGSDIDTPEKAPKRSCHPPPLAPSHASSRSSVSYANSSVLDDHARSGLRYFIGALREEHLPAKSSFVLSRHISRTIQLNGFSNIRHEVPSSIHIS